MCNEHRTNTFELENHFKTHTFCVDTQALGLFSTLSYNLHRVRLLPAHVTHRIASHVEGNARERETKQKLIAATATQYAPAEPVRLLNFYAFNSSELSKSAIADVEYLLF